MHSAPSGAQCIVHSAPSGAPGVSGRAAGGDVGVSDSWCKSDFHRNGSPLFGAVHSAAQRSTAQPSGTPAVRLRLSCCIFIVFHLFVHRSSSSGSSGSFAAQCSSGCSSPAAASSACRPRFFPALHYALLRFVRVSQSGSFAAQCSSGAAACRPFPALH